MLLFFTRTIKFAFQSFVRNIWLSIVTIIILVLTLFSVTMVAGINVIANQAIASVQDKVDVSVYFKPEVAEADVLSLRYRLEELSQVQAVSYVSQADALAQFKERHQDDPVIIESLGNLDKNPLGATLVIKAHRIDEYPAIMTVLDSPENSSLIQDKNFADNKQVIDRLSNLSKRVQRVGIIVCGIFVIIAIMIIFNAIRINIYTHREEIGIMKLVGATNWLVRAPFLTESLFYAVLAVILTVAILYPLLGIAAPQINNFFEGYNLNLVSYFTGNFIRVVVWQLVFAVLLSVVSSSIAIGKYLRV